MCAKKYEEDRKKIKDEISFFIEKKKFFCPVI